MPSVSHHSEGENTHIVPLPAGGEINNFGELTRLFINQFIANRRIVRDPSHLSDIRQSEGESLKEFFCCFTSEARQILGFNPELLRGVFLGGLRPSGFYSALM
ncbi:hypothetical protein KSP40_PGU019130 [Platanthera guangdongensis]|uniref:Retrotransposon gag domain-containing protein n=1 Tax=Platanthera guangdongensis TaxID=2320717 RepID=A0ABR2N0H1_9ASPA